MSEINPKIKILKDGLKVWVRKWDWVSSIGLGICLANKTDKPYPIAFLNRKTLNQFFGFCASDLEFFISCKLQMEMRR